MQIVGIDIGGTFTDFVFTDADGRVHVHKRSSTPADPSIAFMSGLQEAGVRVHRLDRVVHGTTVGTNALIERHGAKTGLITTLGFRDSLEIARSARPPTDYFNLRWSKPEPLVPRNLIVEVDERITFDGSIIRPLSDEDALNGLRSLAEAGCSAIAICLLFSYANPTHERRIAELARQHFPNLVFSVSSYLLPQWREYERASTTVADAFIKPKMSMYFGRLDNELRKEGLSTNLLIMKSNGGLMTAASASRDPVHTFLSGPAGGALAGRFIGDKAGFSDVITMDMGGTSFDVSLVQSGLIAEKTEANAADGVPIQIPMVDIRTIGAGGGSVAWIDSGGAMKVGPRSAGALPGPACYGRGGGEPTITDANLFLGRLGIESTLAGGVALDIEKSAAVIKRLADSLGIDSIKAADGIITICVHNMVNEVRSITAQQGLDPRSFALIAGGGAGPLHAALIAEELGVKTVIVPPFPGLLSASGLLLADLKFDIVRSWPFVLERGDLTKILLAFDEMSAQGRDTLKAEGFKGEPLILKSLDVRYQGQNSEIKVPMDGSERLISDITANFDKMHQMLHGVSVEGAQHEVVNLRVSAVGTQVDAGRWLPKIEQKSGMAVIGNRAVYDSSIAAVVEDANIYDRAAMKEGDRLAGCCIINQLDTTTYVPGNWTGSVDAHGNIILRSRI